MYHEDIKEITKQNTNYRAVLETGRHSQLVVMCLKPGEEIGLETHKTSDQLFFVVEGDGEAKVGEETFGFDDHDMVFVPAGVAHNIKNVGDDNFKFYTVYSPPVHEDGLVQQSKKM